MLSGNSQRHSMFAESSVVNSGYLLNTRMHPTPLEPRRSLNPFRTLVVYRNFRLFWIGQTLSLVGSWMQQVAVGWMALELSNDPFLVGLTAAAGTFPILLFSIPGGIMADRNEKLRVVKIAQALMLIEAIALFAFAATGHLTIHWLLTLVLFGGTLAAFEIPARQSLIVELVGKEDLPSAIGLNSTGFNLARVLGPTAAAVIIAKAGISWTFFLNAASYLAVIIGLLMIKLPERRAEPRVKTSSLEGLNEALRYIRETKPLTELLAIATVYSFLGVPILTLLPIVARDFGIGAGGYGVLMACLGIGAVAGALGIAATGGGARPGRTLRTASVLYPLTLLIFPFLGVPALAGVALFGIGVTMIINNALINARVQHLVPDALRGRVMSLYVMVYIGASPAGSFVAGIIAKFYGAGWAVGGAAAVLLLFGLWIFRREPALSAH
jgi:MFS family permease